MDDQQRDDAGARLEHLREHLAALEGYGNGDTTRAADARAQIADLEAALGGKPARRPRKAQATKDGVQ